MIQVFICILVLGPSLFSFAEGCGRVPATPAPTTTPAPTEPTINGSYRAIECTSDEINKTACLNGGTCFVLVIQDERSANCHCPIEYKGMRCHVYNIEIIVPSSDPDNAVKAGIGASIAVVVVIVIVLTAVAIIHFRRKKAEAAARQKAAKDEEERQKMALPDGHMQANPKFVRNGTVNHVDCEQKKLLYEYQVTSV